MKRILFSLALIGLFLTSNAKTTLTGSVKGMRTGEAEVNYRHNITMKEYSWKAEVSKGKFIIEADIDKPTFAYLMVGDEHTSVYLMPNQNLSVSLNTREFDESIEYTGDYAAENNFLKAYFLEFEDEGKDPTRNWYGELDSKEFQDQHNERLKAKIDFIIRFNETSMLTPKFADYWKNNETYQTYGTFLYYPDIKSYYTKKSRVEVTHTGYFDFLELCDFDNDELTNNGGYTYFLDKYVGHKLNELQSASSGGYDPMNHFLVAQMLLKGKCRTAAQASYLRNALRRIELSSLDPYWDEFKASCEPDVAEHLQGIYDKVVALQPGKNAPQFTLLNIEGEEVSLSDFKGKVVYLDFWASWCGPCMQQVPYAKELKADYADQKDLVFLYLSIDRDEKAWRQAVKDKELKGVHVLAKDFKHEVPQSYNISGIPSYFIIGKDGNIYKNNAPRPSSGNELKDLLNAALAE